MMMLPPLLTVTVELMSTTPLDVTVPETATSSALATMRFPPSSTSIVPLTVIPTALALLPPRVVVSPIWSVAPSSMMTVTPSSMMSSPRTVRLHPALMVMVPSMTTLWDWDQTMLELMSSLQVPVDMAEEMSIFPSPVT